MSNPSIGEIIQNLLSNDTLLDMLEKKGWSVDIDTVHEEELSVLKSPDWELKIRQWDWSNTFMQYVMHEGEIVYYTRGIPGNGLFEHPEIYVSGPWEEEIRKIHSTYMRQERGA